MKEGSIDLKEVKDIITYIHGDVKNLLPQELAHFFIDFYRPEVCKKFFKDVDTKQILEELGYL